MDKANTENDGKYIWDYFQMHASQRLATFNFYIVLSTLLVTGLFTVLKGDFQIPYVGIILGFLLILFSFLFWKLDMRNQTFIKNAENALKYIENQKGLNCVKGEPHALMIFSREEYLTNLLQNRKSFWPWKKYYSYSKCFIIIFVCFGILGIFGTILAIKNCFIY